MQASPQEWEAGRSILVKGESDGREMGEAQVGFSFEDFKVFHALTRPIWVFDVTKRRMHWSNPEGLKLWNASSLEELLARDYLSDMSESTKARLDASLLYLTR